MRMKIDILTLFPKMFEGPLSESIMWRAKDKSYAEINIRNLRDWTHDVRKTVDDRPYGGGAGMLLRVDILDEAITNLRTPHSKVILMDAGGTKFTQKLAQDLSKEKHLIIICGHYEGVDHRVHENLVDYVISVGDYVLTGGEIPAMIIADATIRLIPGVIKEESLKEESYASENTVEYPQYTRPETYKGWKVPDILLSGNHKRIEEWRKDRSGS